MKRRDSLRLIPLSLTGLAGLAGVESFIKTPTDVYAGNIYANNPKGGKHSPVKPLGIQYTDKVRKMLGWIRSTQTGNLLEASYAIARTVKNGGKCWCAWDMGHNTAYDMFPDRNGNPGIFTIGYDPSQSKKGDLFLASIWGGPHEDLVKKDIFVVGGPAPWGMDAKRSDLIVRDSAKVRMRPYSHIWIETNVSTLGAIMDVPGSPAPTGPVSGILGMVTFWMMHADACRILSRDGVKMKVAGDEPVLSGSNIEWADLNAPLMDDYFDALMNQIEMIGSEYGNIRKIAEMAVDSVLAGGKVYCYSRSRNSLSAEGQTRRGGLAMTRGIHFDNGELTGHGTEFKGNKNDLVIMGLFKPDDEYDLRALDIFRKNNMKVVSMGTMTRNIRVPEGRTVPKETDIHVGRMCDTYGRFAIPGFDQKVCPTSGAILNQIFWATCMEMVDTMIRRTGNTPGIFFSAAIKGGTEHMHRVNEIYNERGY
ncbi:hypothetical protein ACFL2X_04545 [Candidatus Latescibacterota bacterium]